MHHDNESWTIGQDTATRGQDATFHPAAQYLRGKPIPHHSVIDETIRP
jgi:hypothetical protein